MWSMTVPISICSTSMHSPKGVFEDCLAGRYAEMRLLEVFGLLHRVYGRLYLAGFRQRMENHQVLFGVLEVLLPYHEAVHYPFRLIRVGEALLLDPADIKDIGIRELGLVLDINLEIERFLDFIEVIIIHPQAWGRN